MVNYMLHQAVEDGLFFMFRLFQGLFYPQPLAFRLVKFGNPLAQF